MELCRPYFGCEQGIRLEAYTLSNAVGKALGLQNPLYLSWLEASTKQHIIGVLASSQM